MIVAHLLWLYDSNVGYTIGVTHLLLEITLRIIYRILKLPPFMVMAFWHPTLWSRLLKIVTALSNFPLFLGLYHFVQDFHRANEAVWEGGNKARIRYSKSGCHDGRNAKLVETNTSIIYLQNRRLYDGAALNFFLWNSLRERRWLDYAFFGRLKRLELRIWRQWSSMARYIELGSC